MKADVLAIGAHPDDVELGVGGLIHKLTQHGRTVVILDLTQGEMGTRGTPELRAAEATEAARILGVTARENADLPDGGLANTADQQRRMIPFIRKYRPSIVLAPMVPDRHPDHQAAHALVRDANFFAGLERIETGQERYRARSLYFYHPYFEAAMPTFVMDVSEHFKVKLEALSAYKSQFYNPERVEPETLVASKEFWESIEKRAAYWGSRVGVAYGEALYVEGPMKAEGMLEG